MRVPSTLGRVGLTAAAVAVCLIGFAPSAGAASPFRVFLTPGPDFTFAGTCAFPVLAHTVTDKEYATFTTLPDGTVTEAITGKAVGEYTNLNSGKSIVVNTSGPGVVTFNTDGTIGVDLRGPSTWLFTPQEQADFGLPQFAYTAGHMQYVYNGGLFQNLTFTGSVTDLCDSLS